MPEPYQLPTALVLASHASGDVATIVIDISREDYLGYPIAPADLREADPFKLVFPLHQLVGRSGTKLTFETYAAAQPLPLAGSTHTFCSWWTGTAMDAALDLDAVWTLADYPDDGGHEHCLFTWETIASYSGHSQGYRSTHGWVTVEAYHEIIEQDGLRLRTQPRSIESRA